MAGKDRHNKILELSIVASLLLSRVTAFHDTIEQQKQPNGGVITQCGYPGTAGYFISNDRVPYSEAENACKALGGFLADVSNENFLLITDVLTTCAGPNKNAWIG